MAIKTLNTYLNKHKDVQSLVRYSTYFESDVLTVTSANNNQYDVNVILECNNGVLLVKIVTLGVKFKVSKVISFQSVKDLIKYLNKPCN